MAEFLRHEACLECGSSDAKAIYSDGGEFCFSCEYTVVGSEKIEENQSKTKAKPKFKNEEQQEVRKLTKEIITEEKAREIKADTVFVEFRGIRSDIAKVFGVRYNVDGDEVLEQYYPVTFEGALSGYKIREIPKNFYSVGATGAECELFGQFKFNRGGKYIIITEGEVDALSAYQIMKDYSSSRGVDYETAVVSPTTGANSHKQIAGQFKFFDSFENIILAYDNDDAGHKAVEKIIKCLPKGKVKIMNMRYKDANEYLQNGKNREFIQDFYDAKSHTPVGVLPSDQIYGKILEQTEIEKVPFPPFLGKLNEMFVGGLPLGHIINIAADTGIGKTTLVNSMIHYWVLNSPHKVGVVSMELDSGQYGEALLSLHIGRKLSLIPSLEDKLKILESERVKGLANQLFIDNNKPRFYLLDNRDGSIEEIQDTVEELVVSCGCKLIVLDPLQDILDGLSNEEQAVFLKWSKGFIKSHGVTFVFINHMRKTPAGQNGADSEQNIMGSSTIIKSASANILLKRDKMAEDPIVRNTTEISVTKNRIYGITGPAGATYYENETSKLYNFDDYMNARI